MDNVKTTLCLLLLSLVCASFSGCETHDENLPGNTPLAAANNPDWDGDGLNNGADNCPRVSNAAQVDTDADGIGDACDSNTDTDADGIDDGIDNCPVYNPLQTDTDQDGIGDDCDNDKDNDGVTNTGLANPDNCPLVANADQKDTDGDGTGDACQTDQDGDGTLDSSDNCPAVANADQQDTDSDNKGDVCDTDSDNDGVDNTADKCPLIVGTGADGCPVDNSPTPPADPNADDDGDTVLNGQDNCPAVANTNQTDTDGDNLGDACDTDLDGDSVTNNLDNCPAIANADQADADGDGTGDACDSNGFTCVTPQPLPAPQSTFQPLLAANYTATGAKSGLCLGCSVGNPANLLDDDGAASGSFASMDIPLSLLAIITGINTSITATAIDTSQNIDTTTVNHIGFVIADTNSQLLNLDALGKALSIDLLDDGAVVRSVKADGSALGVGLLGVGTANTNQRFLALKLDDLPPAAPAFDSIRLNLGGATAALGETLNVYRVCTGP